VIFRRILIVGAQVLIRDEDNKKENYIDYNYIYKGGSIDKSN